MDNESQEINELENLTEDERKEWMENYLKSLSTEMWYGAEKPDWTPVPPRDRKKLTTFNIVPSVIEALKRDVPEGVAPTRYAFAHDRDWAEKWEQLREKEWQKLKAENEFGVIGIGNSGISFPIACGAMFVSPNVELVFHSCGTKSDEPEPDRAATLPYFTRGRGCGKMQPLKSIILAAPLLQFVPNNYKGAARYKLETIMYKQYLKKQKRRYRRLYSRKK